MMSGDGGSAGKRGMSFRDRQCCKDGMSSIGQYTPLGLLGSIGMIEVRTKQLLPFGGFKPKSADRMD